MENIKQQIKDLGFNDQQSEEILNLFSEEVLDAIFKDYASVTTNEDLSIMESRIKESKSPEHFEILIYEIAKTVYGEEADKEIQEMFTKLLNNFKQSIEDSKDLIQRYQQGDPNATELINTVKDSKMYEDLKTTDLI
jgi:tyrosyl-tRNA synthetase